jgi:predicted AlkP superfamily phosphohydrolase/phosphomutase
MILLPGIDRVSHRLWGAIEPESHYPEVLFDSAQRAVAAAALRSYYEYTDALVGLLAEHYGPDDLVMIVSDHGFESGTGLGFLTGVHETAASLDGLVFARGPRIEAAPEKRVVSVNDVTPTILAWLGLPIARDMHGRPAPFLAGDPAAIAQIASYEGAAVDRQADRPSGSEQTMLENLRALGYLEGDASR